MLKVTTAAIFAAAFIAPLNSAIATPLPSPLAHTSQSISLKGMDLTTPQGQAALDAALTRAAKDVCGIEVSHLGSSALRTATKCQNEVMAETRARLSQR